MWRWGVLLVGLTAVACAGCARPLAYDGARLGMGVADVRKLHPDLVEMDLGGALAEAMPETPGPTTQFKVDGAKANALTYGRKPGGGVRLELFVFKEKALDNVVVVFERDAPFDAVRDRLEKENGRRSEGVNAMGTRGAVWERRGASLVMMFPSEQNGLLFLKPQRP
jgi:hypothetical protein